MLKVAIVYRVVQSWRAPVFSRLSNKFDVKVFYGCDFPGTKVVSAPEPHAFPSKKVPSFPLMIRKKSGNMLLPISFGLYRELTEFNPDVVLCEGASNFINNIIIFFYCKRHKKSMVQWGLGKIKGRTDSIVRRVLNPIIQPIEKRANAIVSYSSRGAHYYESLGVEKEKIFVATNVVDTDSRLKEISNFFATNSKINVHGNKFKMVFVGALEQNKRVDLLIRTVSNLRRKYPNISLTVIGDGSERLSLEDLATELEVNDIIEFLGKITGPLISYVYDKDINIMPGLGGLVVSDMLCHGIPTICSIGDGCEADLIDGSNGMLLDTITEDTLFDAISSIIDDENLLTSMKKSARNSIDKHNISNYVESISDAVYFSFEHRH